MARQKFTELNLQRLFLEHPRWGSVPYSLGDIGQLVDDGDSLEVLFKFDPSKNEELTHIFFGLDYEIWEDKPAVGVTLILNVDGTYKSNTDASIKVVNLDSAVAVSDDESISIVNRVSEDDYRAISYSTDVDRFAFSSDLRNKKIQVYRANCIYPRWIESKKRELPASRGRKMENAPLDFIYIITTSVDVIDGQKIGAMRRYKAHLEYHDARMIAACPRQPDNARRIKFNNIQLIEEKTLVPNNEIPSQTAA